MSGNGDKDATLILAPDGDGFGLFIEVTDDVVYVYSYSEM
jgi:hypothetical protein